MFLKDINIALRHIRANLFYTTINIIGLAIGIAASVIITLYVLDELSYDKFHQDSKEIYRVGLRAKISGQEVEAAATCPPMAGIVQTLIPEVKEAIRIAQWQEVPVRFDDQSFTESHVILADSNFFDFFTFDLLEGDPASVLKEVNKVVLSKSLAFKYFPDKSLDEVIGQIIEVGNDRFTCIVTGVVEDAPDNSHIPYNLILSLETWSMAQSTAWINNFLYNYIKLYPDSNPDKVEDQFVTLVEKYVGPEAATVLGMDTENLDDSDFYYGYFLTPIEDIHLHSRVVAELKAVSDIKYVYIFSAIAVFILVIAIINFVNLTTAKGGKRAKEVGIRKTAGALRGRLIGQLLMESSLQAIFAMLVAGALVQISIPFFNQISQKNLSFNVFESPEIILFMLFVAILVGFIAGIYPALFLTAFKPAEILRGYWGGSGQTRIIRSALVIFQFSISTFLIVSTLIVFKQMNLLRNYDLGFSKEQVLVIKNGNSLRDSYAGFKEKLLSVSGIIKISRSTHLPPRVDNSSLFRPDGGNEDRLMNYYWADYDHLNTLDLNMHAGRFYSEDYPSDSFAIVINQVALERFEWETFEGHRVLSFLVSQDSGVYVNVIGVVEDYNFSSLREDIQPMAIVLGDFGNLISVKLETEDYSETLVRIESIWRELSDGAPFDYYFLDDEFESIYRAEERMAQVFMVFTILAIIIACLGLFGLATFTVEQKTREIGIRKALGASLGNIVYTLSSDFMKLVSVSIVISIPISYYIMNNWLQNFAYKTSLGAWIFILSAILVLLIALITVSYQAITSGLSRPSDALKVE